MADLLGIGSAISGIANGIVGGLNYTQQKETAKKNLDFQREQFEYQKQQNLLQQEREDNAVRRRAYDLGEAGFNRLLATQGEGANAGAYGSTNFQGVEAPQMNLGNLGDIASGIEGATYDALNHMNKMKNDETQRSLMQSQDSLALAQASEALSRVNWNNMDSDLKKEMQDYYKTLVQKNNWDLGKFKEYNIPTNWEPHKLMVSAIAGWSKLDYEVKSGQKEPSEEQLKAIAKQEGFEDAESQNIFIQLIQKLVRGLVLEGGHAVKEK